jgi:hypothetical protein
MVFIYIRSYLRLMGFSLSPDFFDQPGYCQAQPSHANQHRTDKSLNKEGSSRKQTGRETTTAPVCNIYFGKTPDRSGYKKGQGQINSNPITA